ncbi:hypothetical protein ACFWIQ_19420 [Kitasatospora sp. NPDC127059]|uniref:hypothetical protein n=1 Tax=unclassified Kitasatospora TaxID=2633591 RepID=UPI003662C5D0
MSVPTEVSRFRLGHRTSVTRTEGVRSTAYRSQWHLFPLGASRRPESGSVVLACLIGGGGAVPGLSGVTGLLAVATGFGVRSAGKTYPGVHLDRNQPATPDTPAPDLRPLTPPDGDPNVRWAGCDCPASGVVPAERSVVNLARPERR